MKEMIVDAVVHGMRDALTAEQLGKLADVMRSALAGCDVTARQSEEEQRNKENAELRRQNRD